MESFVVSLNGKTGVSIVPYPFGRGIFSSTPVKWRVFAVACYRDTDAGTATLTTTLYDKDNFGMAILQAEAHGTGLKTYILSYPMLLDSRFSFVFNVVESQSTAAYAVVMYEEVA